jgi:SPASM domain peptide maturase of grasp-with-spasm system
LSFHKWNKNKHLKLLANCIPVSGAVRSTLCDLNRNRYYIIPNDLSDFLRENEGTTLEEIIEKYGDDNKETILEYINFLENSEMIFWCDKDEIELFPKLNLDWDYPSHVTNAIIDLDSESSFSAASILEQLESLSCFFVQFRSYNKRSLQFWDEIFKPTLNSKFKGFEIYTKYDSSLTWDRLNIFLKTHYRVKIFTVFGSPTSCIQKEGFHSAAVYVTQNIDNETHCGQIHPSYFSVNASMFSESQKFNSCLNRKISIDKNGYIKNCPSMNENYGHINETTLAQAIKNPTFEKYADINKDQIDTCKSCEFRYICTDCRAYLQNQNNLFSKPLKCKYDPFTTHWG